MLRLRVIWAVVRALFSKKADLVAGNLALRQQLVVLRRRTKRPRLLQGDRVSWLWLARSWSRWRDSLIIVKPETVVRWHRKGFKYYRAWKSRHQAGRPAVSPEVRELIRRMSRANPLWGAPRIHGELLKLGINISQATVARYMTRRAKPPSPSWRAFLDNHAKDLIAIDFFTVPTVSFRILFVFLVLSHDRRRILHFNVTAHPSAKWTGRQLLEVFPWNAAPRFLIRDRDGIYGNDFNRSVHALGIKQVLIAPRSPWQNPYVERVIGSIRRECLDHVILLNGDHLREVLRDYLHYYHRSRTHLALDKDAPQPRRVEPPTMGRIVEFPKVGGLHHRYSRQAAQLWSSSNSFDLSGSLRLYHCDPHLLDVIQMHNAVLDNCSTAHDR
jgi:transposase InsO family protein